LNGEAAVAIDTSTRNIKDLTLVSHAKKYPDLLVNDALEI
jgi:hypothetical protein